jgi:hypothetical protein
MIASNSSIFAGFPNSKAASRADSSAVDLRQANRASPVERDFGGPQRFPRLALSQKDESLHSVVVHDLLQLVWIVILRGHRQVAPSFVELAAAGVKSRHPEGHPLLAAL